MAVVRFALCALTPSNQGFECAPSIKRSQDRTSKRKKKNKCWRSEIFYIQNIELTMTKTMERYILHSKHRTEIGNRQPQDSLGVKCGTQCTSIAMYCMREYVSFRTKKFVLDTTDVIGKLYYLTKIYHCVEEEHARDHPSKCRLHKGPFCLSLLY